MSLAERILAGVLIGLFLFLGGYFTGRSSQHNADEAKQGKALEAAVEKHDEAASAGQKVEQQSAVTAAKTEAVFNAIQKGVVTYAQKHPAAGPERQCSLDPDGLRLWRAANAGADLDAASSGDGALPAAAATGERKPDGTVGEPRRSSEGVPPVPRSASGADRLAGEN